ncbi:serine/threonine protein kinase [Oligoflexia bacterium]|nr:serine/threonine protein kinase [Oligoflexia bacterium]
MLETSILEGRPALLNRFELIRTLGEGAAGAVYLVRDLEQKREVALKVLINKGAFDEHTLLRFKQEMEACQQVRHPHIVEAYDYIELPDTIAYTMEYVDGKDLRYLFTEGNIGWEKIDQIFSQLLSALYKLHSHGIVHRDVKLENVLIGADGEVKLSDLGLMKRLDQEGLTRTGVLLGTAQYLPPEYIKATKYDERGDLYVTGVMLFELLTGNRRLSDKAGVEAIEHLIKTKFEIPTIALTGLPPKYIEIVTRAMQPKPSKRYQTALEMQAAFSLPLNGKVDAGVQVKERLSLKGYSLRSSMKIINCSRHLFSTVKKAALVCCVVLAVLLAYYWYSIHNSVPMLKPGKYAGTLRLAEGEKGKKIQIRVDQRGTFVRLGLKRCSAGYISRFSGEILCEQAGIMLNVKRAGIQNYEGQIVDSEHGLIYPFTVQKLDTAAISG